MIADNNNTNNAQIGLKPFFKSKVEALEIAVRDGTQNLRRLEAQRNELNSRGKLSLSLSLLKRNENEKFFFTLVAADVASLFVVALFFFFILSFRAFENKTKRVLSPRR